MGNLMLWAGCQGTQMNNCHENLSTCFTWLSNIQLNAIEDAIGNFEKFNVAMLRGPCLQHVMGNTSRLNQPQSAIIPHMTTQQLYLPRMVTHLADLVTTHGHSLSSCYFFHIMYLPSSHQKRIVSVIFWYWMSLCTLFHSQWGEP